MSVGGRLIEILPMRLDDGTDVLRLWVVDRAHGSPGFNDETCIYAEPQEILPAIGDQVWWQAGKIYFDNDRQHLVKVGNSFAAPGSRE